MNFTDAITNQDHLLTTNHFIDDVIQSQLQQTLTIHFVSAVLFKFFYWVYFCMRYGNFILDNLKIVMPLFLIYLLLGWSESSMNSCLVFSSIAECAACASLKTILARIRGAVYDAWSSSRVPPSDVWNSWLIWNIPFIKEAVVWVAVFFSFSLVVTWNVMLPVS